MKHLYIILFLINTIISCTGSKLSEEKKVIINTDSLSIKKGIDSIILLYSKIDNIELSYMKNEIIDINFDGKQDLVIYFNGTGTGALRLVKIFIYNSKKNNYFLDKELSNLKNPSFYINRKLITAFYIGHGGGDGLKLKWNENKWDTSELITFEPDRFDQKWVTSIYNKNSKLTKTFKLDNFLVPDTSILPNKW